MFDSKVIQSVLEFNARLGACIGKVSASSNVFLAFLPERLREHFIGSLLELEELVGKLSTEIVEPLLHDEVLTLKNRLDAVLSDAMSNNSLAMKDRFRVLNRMFRLQSSLSRTVGRLEGKDVFSVFPVVDIEGHLDVIENELQLVFGKLNDKVVDDEE
ncbi:MAG: hypothetical protein DRP09_15830 [Candidatus Thorarchaeota archaeon]|nr:MAG: hypothetical protein DRP09_15830 [Candidatus Thorarchaeota archaeon]